MDEKNIGYHNSNQIEYTVMESEMTRRKIAFAQLLISFYITIFVLAFRPILSYPEISFPCLSLLAVIFGLLITLVNKMLTKQGEWKCYLTDREIIRKIKNTNEIHLISDIKSIRIKRNCKGLIREMRFRMTRENSFYINGLNDFENFKVRLLTMAKDAKVIHYKEPPIDYDHWLFYLFLGPALGVTATFFFRLMLSAGDAILNYILIMIACYAMILGVFFVICRPVKGRYGTKIRKTDIVCGSLLFIVGFLIFLYNVL